MLAPTDVVKKSGSLNVTSEQFMSLFLPVFYDLISKLWIRFLDQNMAQNIKEFLAKWQGYSTG